MRIGGKEHACRAGSDTRLYYLSITHLPPHTNRLNVAAALHRINLRVAALSRVAGGQEGGSHKTRQRLRDTSPPSLHFQSSQTPPRFSKCSFTALSRQSTMEPENIHVHLLKGLPPPPPPPPTHLCADSDTVTRACRGSRHKPQTSCSTINNTTGRGCPPANPQHFITLNTPAMVWAGRWGARDIGVCVCVCVCNDILQMVQMPYGLLQLIDVCACLCVSV